MKDKIFKYLKDEEKRVEKTYNLIASENLPSKEQLKALGHMINFKYAEGSVGKRYYQGNLNIDKIEKECIDRAKKLFKCRFVNVQALSGSIMNLALISMLLKPYDKILALELSDGGHLSHGSNVNFIGKNYDVINYKLDENDLIDYKDLEVQAILHRPSLIISGCTNYSKNIDFKKIGRIAKKVGAYHLADISHIAGLIVTDNHQSPIKYADFVTTTTHKTLRCVRGGLILSDKKEHEYIVNKCIFPHFQGGLHSNTIAAIAIGLKEASTEKFDKYIEKVLDNTNYMCEELKKNELKIVSNGTNNHMFCIDLNKEKINGRDAAEKLEKLGIICNANTIPHDKGTALNPHGLRFGLALKTTKGITKKEMDNIVKLIVKVIK